MVDKEFIFLAKYIVIGGQEEVRQRGNDTQHPPQKSVILT